jgi:hypothetical protein
MILIGIDPDTKASGVAIYNSKSKDLIYLRNLSFFDLYEKLKYEKESSELSNRLHDLKVILEAGWLNKGNWHTSGSSKTASTAIGNKTGANHETGRKIEEMLIYLGIPYELRKPTNAKVDSKYFKKLTGIEKSNQDQRDAGMLIWGY